MLVGDDVEVAVGPITHARLCIGIFVRRHVRCTPHAQHHLVPADVLAYRRELPEERPPLRGWRAPILELAGRAWPFDEPDASFPPEVRNAADIVARQLARDGFNMRVYVPYGKHWYPYFMRRLAERPANIWFVLKNLAKG